MNNIIKEKQFLINELFKWLIENEKGIQFTILNIKYEYLIFYSNHHDEILLKNLDKWKVLKQKYVYNILIKMDIKSIEKLLFTVL